nr:MAG TPA: hypothetical protein [Bacteriophage sp.]DAH55961.1 MAG TPA: hypothetical protein [Caudoviricetes sp.]DAR58192.1 MAG TPA: hypothetical protein [Caudoviricetes sp.]
MLVILTNPFSKRSFVENYLERDFRALGFRTLGLFCCP